METNHFVGKTADGRRVWVSLRLTRTTRPAWSTDDDTQIHNALEFAASGVVKYKGEHGWGSCGQCLDVLTEITKPAEYWTLAELAELHALWQRWHLNTMRAACAHMTLPESKRYEDRQDIVCDQGLQHGVTCRECDQGLQHAVICREGPYKYGSAWLTEPMTLSVHDRIVFFKDTKPTCELPSDS